MKQAKPRLIHIEIDLMNNFKRLGVGAKLLNGKETASSDARYVSTWVTMTDSISIGSGCRRAGCR